MPNEDVYEGAEAPEEATETAAPEVEAEAKPKAKINRPKDPNSATGKVWGLCDQYWGQEDYTKKVREAAKDADINAATCSTQMSRYKQFMDQSADAE